MRRSLVSALVVAAGMAVVPSAFAAPLTPAFTYQGELLKSGSAVSGTADFRFTLWDAAAGGAQIGALIPRNNVSVSGGVFTVDLDFGAAAFANGEARWLQIEVRSPAGGGAFTLLGTRQPVTATPYAVTAMQGAPGFQVKRTTSAHSVVIDPGTTQQVAQRNSLGNVSSSAGLNGDGGLFRAFQSNGGTVFTAGASGDNSAFLQMWADTGFTNVLIESESSEFGQSGWVNLGGSSTGGVGGVYTADNNDGDRTFQVIGGAGASSSELSMFHDGVEALRIFGDTSLPGGSIYTFDENGQSEWVLEPDFSGDGAFMAFNEAETGNSMSLQSDVSGSPAISMNGDGSSFSVSTNNTGDSAVTMATGAVNSVEMFNEPGIANQQVGFITITTATTSLISRSITVPGSGFVVAIFDSDTAIQHVSGSGTSTCNWAIDDAAGTTGGGNDDMLWLIPSSMPSGLYDFSASSHAVFSVPSAGTYTYHVNMSRSGNTTDGDLFDGQLTLMYFPTAYGTTVPSFTGPDFRGEGTTNTGPSRMPQTGAQIASERAQSQTANMARMNAELAAMKQEMAELRAMMANDPNFKAMRARDAVKGKVAPASAVEENAVPVADTDSDEIADAGR